MHLQHGTVEMELPMIRTSYYILVVQKLYVVKGYLNPNEGIVCEL